MTTFASRAVPTQVFNRFQLALGELRVKRELLIAYIEGMGTILYTLPTAELIKELPAHCRVEPGHSSKPTIAKWIFYSFVGLSGFFGIILYSLHQVIGMFLLGSVLGMVAGLPVGLIAGYVKADKPFWIVFFDKSGRGRNGKHKLRLYKYDPLYTNLLYKEMEEEQKQAKNDGLQYFGSMPARTAGGIYSMLKMPYLRSFYSYKKERWSGAKTMAFTGAIVVLAIIAFLIFGELYK